VARAISGIIFENQGVFLEILGRWLDYKEIEGPLCKTGLNFWLRFIFQWKKHRLGPWLMDQRRAWSTVDRPPWPAIELDRPRPSGLSGARWLTRGGATGRQVH
jgi:hypothetical protein